MSRAFVESAFTRTAKKRKSAHPEHGETVPTSYSASYTPGTEWAAQHLRETFKMRAEDGSLVMLKPPPFPSRRAR